MKQRALLCWSRSQKVAKRGLDTSKVRSSRSFNVQALEIAEAQVLARAIIRYFALAFER